METQQRKRSVVTLLLLLILFGKGNDKWLYSKVFLMVSFHSSKLQYVSCQRHPFYSWPNSKCSKACLITLLDHKLQIFKTLHKLAIFGIFNELLSSQNVDVARFARNVE